MLYKTENKTKRNVFEKPLQKLGTNERKKMTEKEKKEEMIFMKNNRRNNRKLSGKCPIKKKAEKERTKKMFSFCFFFSFFVFLKCVFDIQFCHQTQSLL